MDRLHSKVVMVFLAVFMSAGVFAHTVPGGTVFKAALNGGQEVSTVMIPGASLPVVNGPVVTGAFGMVHFKLSADRQSLEYQLQASNFGTPVIAAHIHLGPKGANGTRAGYLVQPSDTGRFHGHGKWYHYRG
ncbi:MAG: CHRD domain-containing protein [Gammaproteobacteria bacterium]|nr:CHRD domain-containing protein [Gammaproteobacteria bacterium]